MVSKMDLRRCSRRSGGGGSRRDRVGNPRKSLSAGENRPVATASSQHFRRTPAGASWFAQSRTHELRCVPMGRNSAFYQRHIRAAMPARICALLPFGVRAFGGERLAFGFSSLECACGSAATGWVCRVPSERTYNPGWRENTPRIGREDRAPTVRVAPYSCSD